MILEAMGINIVRNISGYTDKWKHVVMTIKVIQNTQDNSRICLIYQFIVDTI